MLPANLPLQAVSPPNWVEAVLTDFDQFLRDHASCERKAAALAMSFVTKYGDRTALIEPMIALAREELEHFQQVFRLMNQRAVPTHTQDEADPYIQAILTRLRHGRDERLLDRLIMSGLVEARGYERFGILAQALTDPELANFYRRLADREAGHFKIFHRLALHYFSQSEVDNALDRIGGFEAQAMLQAELRPRLH